MGTLALRIDETTTIEAFGSRQEPAIEFGDGDRQWAVRFIGSYEDVQRLLGEGLRHLFLLPDVTSPQLRGDIPPDYVDRYRREGTSD